MHTPEQAKELWCPHARVAQVGAVETQAAYNRSLSKLHVPVKVAQAGPEDFELGVEPRSKIATMLTLEAHPSTAANCLGDKCAAWRWEVKSQDVYRLSVACAKPFAEFEAERPAGLNPEYVFHPYDEAEGEPAKWIEPEHLAQARRTGFCGIAGRPEVA